MNDLDQLERVLGSRLRATFDACISDEQLGSAAPVSERSLVDDTVSYTAAGPSRFDPNTVSVERHVDARPRRWIAGAAAAAVVALGFGGLVVLERNDESSNAPADQPATDAPSADTSVSEGAVTTVPPTDGLHPATTPPSSRRLADTVGLTASDWVLASAPPPGTEMVLARRDIAEPDETRIVAYGPAAGDNVDLALTIEIDPPPSQASEQSVTIAGAEWSVNVTEPGDWNVSRRIGDQHVEVQGSGKIDNDLLASLVVVDEVELPLIPLGRRSDARVVASTDFEDATYTYAVQESGRYRCAWFSSGDEGGGHYCGPVQSGAVVVIDGTQSIPDQPGRVVAAAWGSVTSDITSVEVEFVDGAVVTVQPGDLIDTLDKRFWIATDNRVSQGSAVAAVRAYDSNGLLVATEKPTPRG